MFLFFFFYYLIFSLPWGVGFGASAGVQCHYSGQLLGDTETPFSGFHLLHWEIIDNELILSAEWIQAKEPMEILFSRIYERQCTTRFNTKQSEVQKKQKAFKQMRWIFKSHEYLLNGHFILISDTYMYLLFIRFFISLLTSVLDWFLSFF